MNCNRARHLFGACWDDELTQAERDWLEGHLASCPRCRTEYDEFSRTLELTAALPRVEASADLVERVLVRSRRALTAPDFVREPGLRWVPTAAAAVAAVLAVVGALLFLPGSPWRVPGPTGAAQVASASGGPAEPILVSSRDVKASERRGAESRAGAGVAASPFDPSKDVEFVLDPVTLHRGRASVDTGRRRDAEGNRETITF
jgi:anti-sigma factor RsiW